MLWTPKTKAERVGNLKVRKSFKLLSVILAGLLFTTGVCYAAVNNIKKVEKKAKGSIYEQILDDHGFIYGINFYAVPGGLGDTPATGANCEFNAESLRCGLYNIKQTGMDAVQLWLFNRTCGLEYSENGDILGVQEKFLANLKTTCEIAKEIGINLSFTIQPHFDYTIESGLYSGSKTNYDKYTRFIREPEIREHYIEKAVKPVLNVLKNYPEILFGVTAYCEPEGDIYGEQNGWLPWGTTIETMTEFLTRLVDTTREILPGIPVSLASGWNYEDSVRYFNKLGLDYIGMDIYDDDGKVKDLSQMMMTSPVMMTEFGPSTGASSTNSYFHMTNYQNFIANAKLGGYIGAFYWCYNGRGSMMSFLGSSDYDYLPMMASVHYTITDDRKAQQGKEDENDVPVMLYPGNDGTIKFFGSRTATSYTFERSKDGKKWEDAGTFDSTEIDVNYTLICSHFDKDTEAGNTYYYRVTANDEDGSKHTSDISYPIKAMKTICSEEENLVPDYSFEKYDNPTDEGAFNIYSDVTGKHFSFVTGEAGDTVRSGNKAFRMEGCNDWSWVGRTITGLKPNTKYVYTFNVWADGEGAMHAKVLDPKRNNIALYIVSAAHQNEWVQYTNIIETGDYDTISLSFHDVGGTFNIDDLYLFEYVE